MKFEHFMDYFTSELRANDLLYVIDSNVKPSSKLDESRVEIAIYLPDYGLGPDPI